jgi:hypothetical protein
MREVRGLDILKAGVAVETSSVDPEEDYGSDESFTLLLFWARISPRRRTMSVLQPNRVRMLQHVGS